MAIALDMKREWHRFKHDRPGQRFENHRQRMQQHSRAHKIARGTAGFALVAIGIVFCFLPGPGLLGVVFGLALLAGMSRWLSHRLDRIEPRMRDGLHRANGWWHALSTQRRALLVGCAAITLAAGVDLVWRNWVGPLVS
jgi:hypothetical protein